MKLGSRVRDPSFPTDYVTRAKKDGHSRLPPEGGRRGSLTVREAVDATFGSPPRGIQRLLTVNT